MNIVKLYKKGRRDFSGENLKDVYLRGEDLSGIDFSSANLCGADLSNTNLNNANLSGANLCRVNLSGANLIDADLFGANLYGSNLCDICIEKTHLQWANTNGVSIRAEDYKALREENSTNIKIRCAWSEQQGRCTGGLTCISSFGTDAYYIGTDGNNYSEVWVCNKCKRKFTRSYKWKLFKEKS
jgi:hypothetical protein